MAKKILTENKVIVDKNGNIKTVFCENTVKNGGGISVQEMRHLLHQMINKIYETSKK
jgi:predicted outer membrane repeat protein